MTLSIGTHLGPYEIVSPLGAGGMGEVYRAKDTKLDREVAIKVLPELFSRDPERVQRFQCEAKVLASLNHPNIAAIFGFEEANQKNFLVMELVEGDTLAERLKVGPMPVEEALSVGKQISEALEAAHERGVIHRDLKPANIKITPEGKVKVLDFGLAKAMATADERTQTGAADSPTITADFTRPGTILDTAAYMSPEQARGKPLDKRTDIWSFGCVLYECLGGCKPFEGETATDLIAKILERDPNWDNLPANTPPVVIALIQRCFRKDRQERLRDIGEAWVVLNGALSGKLSGLALTGYSASPEASAFRRSLPWACCFALTIALLASLSRTWRSAGPDVTRSIRGNIEISPDQPLISHTGAQFAFSPDGALLAYVAGSGQDQKLFLRRMDQLQSSALSGTIAAKHPFFSPDGQWIAFFTKSHLKKISISGGTPVTLCTVDDDSRGGTWSADETIVLAPSTESGLLRIHSAGGQPEELTVRVEGKERSHRWPRFTPDGRHVLFTSQLFTTDFDGSSIEVLSLDTMQRQVIHRGGSYPQFVPGGYILFVREGTVYAARVNTDTWELRSAPAPIIEGVRFDPRNGGAQIAFANNGTMAFGHGTARAANSLVMIERDGTVSPLIANLRTYYSPRFSPDGKHLAVSMLRPDSTMSDIWLYDMTRETLSRLTFTDAEDFGPLWSPNGKRIAFGSLRDGVRPNMYVRRADGSGEVQRLQVSERVQIPLAFTPDGTTIIYFEVNKTKGDLWSLSLKDGAKPEPFLVTPFDERQAALSPDGHWLAYTSNESGHDEIYLRPFPKAPGKWQISTSGGQHSLWSPKGKELFYRKDDTIMSLAIDLSVEVPVIGRPTALVEFASDGVGSNRDYDISPDGQRFVIVQDEFAGEQAERSHLRFVFNWFSELEAKIPKGKK